MDSTPLKEGADFTELTADLETRIDDLCSRTYKATKRPLPEKETRELIDLANAQINEFDGLAKAYSGGRRDAIVSAGAQLVMLKQFVESLRSQLPKP